MLQSSETVKTARQDYCGGGEVASLTFWPHFTPHEDYWYSFCQRLNKPQGHSVVQNIRYIGKFRDLIRILTCHLLICSIVPQLIMLWHAPNQVVIPSSSFLFLERTFWSTFCSLLFINH